MARKRKNTEAPATTAAVTVGDASAAPPATTTKRVTRSSTRQATNSAPPPPPPTKKSKGRPRATSQAPPPTSEIAAAIGEGERESGTITDEEPENAADVAKPTAASPAKGPTVVIEHCKQCTRFKTRAFQVKKGLEDGVPGITVVINPEKPRRGAFEIREEGGQTFISLQGLQRPFKPLTDLNMENVIKDIVGKISS